MSNKTTDPNALYCLQLISYGKQFQGRLAELALEIAEKKPEWFEIVDSKDNDGRILVRDIMFTDEFLGILNPFFNL
jgi:hypothetical protein